VLLGHGKVLCFMRCYCLSGAVLNPEQYVHKHSANMVAVETEQNECVQFSHSHL